jgi:hypothetical protein
VTLRTGVLCAALALCIAASAAAFAGHVGAWFFAFEAAAAAALILFERSRYRSRGRTVAGAGFEPTNERFIDPSTGRETVVYFNPTTGERDYRPRA